MFKRVVMAVVLVVLGAGIQGAAAGHQPGQSAVATSPETGAAAPAGRSSRVQSPNIRAGSAGVTGAATGTYVSQTYRGGGYQGAPAANFWGTGTTFACLGLSPIISGVLVNANEHRQLTSREVHVMLADCTIPFIGGWLMGKYWDSIEARQHAAGRAPHAAVAHGPVR
jgi:uncharacterized membrane protein